tara:strand:+ start:842 stop:1312 length:471 start_codon:yes stop_codon:yes gene_type:complete
MRLIGQYTARGIVSEDETFAGNPQKIPLFDGSFETAYRVKEFYIFPADFNSSAQPDVIGKLSKNDDGAVTTTNFWRADDDNQIAWSGVSGSTDTITGPTFTVVDPDNLIVEDLYIYARTAGDTNNAINYLVVMEKYEIDDWQGALAMARDRAQGDL